MRLIFLYMLLANFILANDLKINTTGNIEVSNINNDNKNNTLLDLNINNDFYYDRLKIGTSLGSYINNNSTYNNNVKTYVNRVEMYKIDELYINYHLTDELSYSFGVFPFKKGTFYEYGYNGNRKGIGLYTLSDANLQGSILTYNKDVHTFQIGNVAYEKYFKTYIDKKEGNGPITFDSYKNSGMNYISYKYNRKKWYSEFMVTDIYQYVNDVKIMDTNTFSMGLSYDDEIESGRTYYSILTLSDTKGDNSSLSEIGRFSNEEYHFDNFDSNGYSLLLGIKQEIDNVVFNKDIVLGFEYLHRSEGYHSLLAGEPLSYDSYSNIGDSYNTYIGLRYDKNTILKLRYYYYDADNRMTKGILSTETTDLIKKDGNGNYDSVILQLYIDF